MATPSQATDAHSYSHSHFDTMKREEEEEDDDEEEEEDEEEEKKEDVVAEGSGGTGDTKAKTSARTRARKSTKPRASGKEGSEGAGVSGSAVGGEREVVEHIELSEMYFQHVTVAPIHVKVDDLSNNLFTCLTS